MKTPFIIILLLLSSLFIKAQNKISHAQPDSIIKIIPEGRHYLYTIGGKLETAEDVKIRLLAYAPSAAEFGALKSDITWTYVSMGGAVVASAASIAAFVHHNNVVMSNAPTAGLVNGQPGFIYPPQHHTSLTGAYVFTGLATAFFINAIIHIAKAGTHANKAVKIYNQQYE